MIGPTGGNQEVFKDTDVPVDALFDCLDRGYNLYTFLDRFPSVSRDQVLAAMKERLNVNSVIHSDTRIMSGSPVFKGTRLLVKNLFDYLAAGENLEEFLYSFPTAKREQAVMALQMARRMLEINAYETVPSEQEEKRHATH